MKLLFMFILLFSIVNANEKVVLQLKWLHQFQFAGYYMAKEKGFFSDLGLDVEIRQRDVKKNNIDQVLDGEAHYGIADSVLFLYKAKGKPVVVVAPIFQHSPSVLFTLKESGLDSPYSLKNKDMAFYKKDTDGYGVLAMFRGIGVSPNFHRNKTRDSYKDLLNKKIDILSGYLTNEAFYFKDIGVGVNIINPSNYGMDLYGDMLFTTEYEAETNPKRVQSFRDATVKGWDYALENIEETVQLIKSKYAINKSVEHLRYEAKALADIIQKDSIPLGSFDKGRVKYTLDTYKKFGLIDKSINIDEYIFDFSSKKVKLTALEREWLSDNPNIFLTMQSGQEPVTITNSDGTLSGILPDFFSEFSNSLGHKIGLTHYDISKENIVEATKKDGVYGTATVFKEHGDLFNLTKSYMDTSFYFFSHKNMRNKIKNESDLKGKKVAVLKRNYKLIKYIESIGGVEVVLADSVAKQLELVQYEEVDAVVGYVTYNYLINKLLFDNIYPVFISKQSFGVHMGINSEHKILLGILDKCIDTLSEKKKYEIFSKWINKKQYKNQENMRITLDTKESSYLSQKKVISMCIDPDWMPFEKNENGKHIGMSADYVSLLEKQIGYKIKMLPTKSWGESLEFGKDRKCDIFSLVMPTKERREYLNFTKPYLKVPLVIVTNLDEIFISDITNVSDRPIGIVKGYAYGEILREKYPNMKLVDVENLKDGLDKVKSEELFGFIGTLATTGYQIQKSYIGQLKIAGKFDESWDLGIGTRNDEPLLNSIFNKAINGISTEQHQAILNKWISVNYQKNADYGLIFKWIGGIVIVFIIILSIVVTANRKLNDEIKRRKKIEQKLQKLSITDELTHLHNRRYFNDVLPKVLSSAKREKENICFAILDIDYFKAYNDTYGHIAGDDVLKQVSITMSESLKRADDYCFRLGGEEFGILFRDLDSSNPYELVENIRKEIEALHVKHKESQAGEFLTISAGLVIIDALSVEDTIELYREADDLLYKAKEEGRNRVIANI